MSVAAETIQEEHALLAGKYLTFCLDGETYGLEILRVQEIIGMMRVTRVPRAPEYIRGVINLRGKVIPVLELRPRFGLPRIPENEKTCIIVAQIAVGERSITMGVIVDEVSEVVNIASNKIENTPEFGSTVQADFIRGIGKMDNKVIMLLDVDKVFGGEMFHELSSTESY